MDLNKYIMRRILRQSMRSMRTHANCHNMEHLANSKVSGTGWKGRQDFLNLASSTIKLSNTSDQNKKNEETEKSFRNESKAETTNTCEDQPNRIISEEPSSSSSYMLASDRSIFSHQVDSWLRDNMVSTENAAVQRSRVPLVQRSTLTATSLNPAGSSMWYILAMLLPLCSINNYLQWTCSTSDIINTAELFLANLARFYGEIRNHTLRLADDHLARDLFATLMDIILVLYAIGFLFLSLYQATAFR